VWIYEEKDLIAEIRTMEKVMIHLESVTQNNIDELLGLSVREDQRSFVSSVAESLAQAYVYSETAYPFAVYEDDTLVGFIMMGYYDVKQYYTLWKFLIDKRYQNQGYGRQALELGLAYIRGKFNSPDIYTGVAPGNTVAKNLYRSVGFQDTGLIECGMEEMKYSVTDANMENGIRIYS
jgi:diamine N-acetyltransferase